MATPAPLEATPAAGAARRALRQALGAGLALVAWWLVYSRLGALAGCFSGIGSGIGWQGLQSANRRKCRYIAASLCVENWPAKIARKRRA